MKDYREKLKNITQFIFDYDGVLSDGRILFSDDGQQMRNGHVRDGYAIQLAQKLGLKVAIISGANTPGIQHRCSLLKIEDAFLGVCNKIEVYEQFKKEKQLSDEEILFMGDDIPDYQIMQKVGIACCPADAARDIAHIAHYISPFKGGEGCVRDVIEQVLRAKELWLTEEAFIW